MLTKFLCYIWGGFNYHPAYYLGVSEAWGILVDMGIKDTAVITKYLFS